MAGTATLPDGFRTSIWADLDPAARDAFLTDLLIAKPGLATQGAVDFEAAREPVLIDQLTGDLVSIAGDIVLPAPRRKPNNLAPLAVTIGPGGFKAAGLEFPPAAIAAVLALGGLILIDALLQR